MVRISNMSFFRFCWKNEKLDWPKCARTRKEISKVISVGVEGKKFAKGGRHDVLLVLLFWLGALEFKILKFLFFCCLNIFLGNFPRFSLHKSLKILEKFIVNFFKGYINYFRTNQTSSQVHLRGCPRKNR